MISISDGQRYQVLAVLFLMLAVFFLRTGAFSEDGPFTYDEYVYSTLAAQIMESPSNYNTIGIYEEAKMEGRILPSYFKKKIFKHPPLFASLVSGSYSIFGVSYSSAYRVSLVLGVLLILIAYLLAKELFGPAIGLYSAFLMAIEPVNWICSQKIWLETTLAFFTVLSVYFFVLYLKRERTGYVIAAYVAAGLAALTKYPGMLALMGMVVYASLFNRGLFGKKAFTLGMIIPLIMLLPWAIWNYMVYGMGMTGMFGSDVNVIRFFSNLKNAQLSFAIILSVIILCGSYSAMRRKNVTLPGGSLIWKILSIGLVCGTFVLFGRHIFSALKFDHIPASGWMMGMFHKEPWGYYPWKLIELSPLYIFSYLALPMSAWNSTKRRDYLILITFSFMLLTFWMFWGAYQSRYVSAPAVLLIILSAAVQGDILKRMNWIADRDKARRLIAVFVLFAVYILLRTVYVDLILAVPNTTAYF